MREGSRGSFKEYNSYNDVKTDNMKIKLLYTALAALLVMTGLASCDGEKDLVIIEGNLPIKTSVLYMVGDATPNGWSIDAPTPLEPTAEDPLVFTWEGQLGTGEMKLCLTTGSWDAAFIRPENDGEEISSSPVSGRKFIMHAGDPDNKWRVTEAGKYRLTFDLRNWTMSYEMTGVAETPATEPIVTDVLYIVGDATPAGWNIDAPTRLEKTSDYVFVYEGPLTAGELKACIATGDWGASFIRPSSNGCKIGRDGVESTGFVFTTAPDDKWVVEEAGNYRLTFDLENYTIAAEYLGATETETSPIETETLFMIGDATPGGWSMDNASEFVRSADNKYVFTWEGELVPGTMKACTERDGTFSCPFLRPSSNGVEISSAGVASPEFVYTTNPDDQWRITEAGIYRLTFDLEKWTLEAEKLN